MNIPWNQSARETFEVMLKAAKMCGLPGEREDHISKIEYEARDCAKRVSQATRENIMAKVLEVHVRHHFKEETARFNARKPE